MKKLTYAEVNKSLALYVTNERLPIGWKGDVLDLLEYTDLPLDARVSAALIVLHDNHGLIESFAAWCKGQLQDIQETESGRKALEYAGKYDGKGNINILASYMRRAYYERRYAQTKNLSQAVSALIGAAGAQAIALYKIVKEDAKGSN